MGAGTANGIERATPSGVSMLLSHYFETFYVLRPRVRSERTRQFYRDEIHKLERCHGGPLLLEELSEPLVLRSCREQLAAGRSYATVQKHQTAIRALWAYAHKKRNSLGINVAEVPEFERWPELEREPECWSIDELSKILSAAALEGGFYGTTPAGLFWQALIMTCYQTGGRISAVMRARWEDYDAECGLLLLKAEFAKDKADTRAHLPAPLMDLLARLPREGERIFDAWPYDRHTRTHSYTSLARKFGRIIKASGMECQPGERFHRLRRTFATYVASKLGKSVAQTMLGHSSLRVTERYLDKSKLDVPRACDVLPEPTIQGLRLCS